jgi:hypothetical protein
MGVKVGMPIDVGHVISKSIELIRKKPQLLIPQVIVLIISLLEDVANSSTVSALGIVFGLVSLIVSIVVIGAYPSLVQEALRGEPLNIGNALRQAASRIVALVIAGIIVGILLVIGFILIIVPGIIFLTWWAYTVPAIMLENKGATAGMAASKAFGRDKKLSTFLLAVVALVAIIIVEVIMVAVSLGSPLAGHVVYSVLLVPIDAWISVMITYTYLTYGPSAAPPVSQVITPGTIPPPPPGPPGPMDQPVVPAAQQGAAFCRNCGSPLAPGAQFCANCGSKV